MGTTQYDTLRERVARANGFYYERAVTTAITTNNSIVCTHLSGEVSASDDYLIDKWILITSGANDNVERLITDYVVSTDTITVGGAALASDGTSKANFELHEFKPSDIKDALNRAAKEEFDKIFREIEDTSLFTRHAQTWYPFPTDMTDVFKVEVERHLSPEFKENILYEEGASVDFNDWDESTYPNGASTPSNITCTKYGTTDQESNWIPTQYQDYIMKMVTNTSSGYITWVISTYASYLGQKVVVSVPIYCRTASEFYVSISDGAGGDSDSSYHTGTGWENIEVTRNISTSASKFEVKIESAGLTSTGYAAQIIVSRAEYYLSHAWTGTGAWKSWNDYIVFDHAPTEGKFLRIYGKKLLSELDADTDTVERSDPEVQILIWGASVYLWRARANAAYMSDKNPYNERLAYAEKQLETMRKKYGVKQPSLTMARAM